jgi:hypothetical protein
VYTYVTTDNSGVTEYVIIESCSFDVNTIGEATCINKNEYRKNTTISEQIHPITVPINTIIPTSGSTINPKPTLSIPSITNGPSNSLTTSITQTPTTSTMSAAVPTIPNRKKSSSNVIPIAAGVGGGVAIILILLLIFIVRKRQRCDLHQPVLSSMDEINIYEPIVLPSLVAETVAGHNNPDDANGNITLLGSSPSSKQVPEVASDLSSIPCVGYFNPDTLSDENFFQHNVIQSTTSQSIKFLSHRRFTLCDSCTTGELCDSCTTGENKDFRREYSRNIPSRL